MLALENPNAPANSTRSTTAFTAHASPAAPLQVRTSKTGDHSSSHAWRIGAGLDSLVSCVTFMATEPQWRRPWEDRPAEEHQSSSSLASAASSQPASTQLQSTSPPLPSGHTRRLPPLHAGLEAFADARTLSARRASLTYATEITSPNIAWQNEGAASSKRRRLGDAERAYSPSHDGSSPQFSQLPNPVVSNAASTLPELPDKYSRRATTRSADDSATKSAESRRPSQDLLSHPGSLISCCSLACPGQRCSTLRALVADITWEFCELDSRLQGAISGSAQTPRAAPDVEQSGLVATLEWVLDRLRWNNAGIRSLARTNDTAPQGQQQEGHEDQQTPSGSQPPPEGNTDLAALGASDLPGAMKRRRSQSDKEGQVPPRRAAPPLQPAPAPPNTVYAPTPIAGPSRQAPAFSPTGMPESLWQNQYAPPSAEHPPVSHSPRRTGSSTGSAFHPSQHSPMQAPQHQHGQQGRMLPSPSSMNFPTGVHGQIPPPLALAGPSTSPLQPPQLSSPAHMQHLQDLQHQVSIKTLALQTLQREYDALLAKLERQRTKCLTLEKKFEVSDVEINSLTDERERLQAQVAALETQAEELTRSRDDARKEMVESGRQYVRIVEMASRLQARGAEERRKWEEEKAELMERIKALELGLPEGEREAEGGEVEYEMESTADMTDAAEGASAGQPSSRASGVGSEPQRISSPPASTATSTRQPQQTILALRAEIRRLRSRTQALEGIIRTMKEENSSMQEALRAVTASGERMQEAMDRALGA